MNGLFLAVEETLPPRGPVTPAMRETLIVIGAILLVALGLLIWAGAVRKKRRRRSTPHRPHYHQDSPDRSAEGDAEAPLSSHSHRRRRRRREHRPRNPTLAETGGLPPIRSERPPGPPQSPAQP